MRSEKVELRLPHEISEGANKRAERESYRNCKRYILGLIVDDLIHPRKHTTLAHTIANADPELQDSLLDVFLKISREELRRIVISIVKERKAI